MASWVHIKKNIALKIHSKLHLSVWSYFLCLNKTSVNVFLLPSSGLKCCASLFLALAPQR